MSCSFPCLMLTPRQGNRTCTRIGRWRHWSHLLIWVADCSLLPFLQAIVSLSPGLQMLLAAVEKGSTWPQHTDTQKAVAHPHFLCCNWIWKAGGQHLITEATSFRAGRFPCTQTFRTLDGDGNKTLKENSVLERWLRLVKPLHFSPFH